MASTSHFLVLQREKVLAPTPWGGFSALCLWESLLFAGYFHDVLSPCSLPTSEEKVPPMLGLLSVQGLVSSWLPAVGGLTPRFTSGSCCSWESCAIVPGRRQPMNMAASHASAAGVIVPEQSQPLLCPG